MANFYIDHEGTRYGFRYVTKRHLEIFLNSNCVSVEDIECDVTESEPAPPDEPTVSGTITEEGTYAEDGPYAEPDEVLTNNGEYSKGAKALAEEHSLDLTKIPANGGKVNKAHVQAVIDAE